MVCWIIDGCCLFFFFFKQKTAYEMRISDWSSDVCSSDLLRTRQGRKGGNDQNAQGLFVGHAQGVGTEAAIAGQLWLLQDGLAKCRPLALVLQSQHDLGAVSDRKWAVRVNGGMGCTGTRRRRGPARKGVV